MADRLSVASLLLACVPLGCVAYEHQVDVEVHDPRGVWVEEASTHRFFEPAKLDHETPMPGTSTTVERESSGALEVGGRRVVGPAGSFSMPPSTLDRVEREGDVLRVPICRPHKACVEGLRLATRSENVRLVRERDVPSWYIGALELLLGGAAFVGSRVAWRPQTSGGPLLLSAGIGLTIHGVLQIISPAKNETRRVP